MVNTERYSKACEHCGGWCCRTFFITMPVTPEGLVDWDAAAEKYPEEDTEFHRENFVQLRPPGGKVVLRYGELEASVAFRCRKLVQGKCTAHGKHPQVCRKYLCPTARKHVVPPQLRMPPEQLSAWWYTLAGESDALDSPPGIYGIQADYSKRCDQLDRIALSRLRPLQRRTLRSMGQSPSLRRWKAKWRRRNRKQRWEQLKYARACEKCADDIVDCAECVGDTVYECAYPKEISNAR